ncbi:MAG: hypothetical protein QG632_321 [Candidatus Dependentiae bacterium]|nr:hypothetical protein [Candidatus Dependentiae bacterium]
MKKLVLFLMSFLVAGCPVLASNTPSRCTKKASVGSSQQKEYVQWQKKMAKKDRLTKKKEDKRIAAEYLEEDQALVNLFGDRKFRLFFDKLCSGTYTDESILETLQSRCQVLSRDEKVLLTVPTKFAWLLCCDREAGLPVEVFTKVIEISETLPEQRRQLLVASMPFALSFSGSDFGSFDLYKRKENLKTMLEHLAPCGDFEIVRQLFLEPGQWSIGSRVNVNADGSFNSSGPEEPGPGCLLVDVIDTKFKELVVAAFGKAMPVSGESPARERALLSDLSFVTFPLSIEEAVESVCDCTPVPFPSLDDVPSPIESEAVVLAPTRRPRSELLVQRSWLESTDDKPLYADDAGYVREVDRLRQQLQCGVDWIAVRPALLHSTEYAPERLAVFNSFCDSASLVVPVAVSVPIVPQCSRLVFAAPVANVFSPKFLKIACLALPSRGECTVEQRKILSAVYRVLMFNKRARDMLTLCDAPAISIASIESVGTAVLPDVANTGDLEVVRPHRSKRPSTREKRPSAKCLRVVVNEIEQSLPMAELAPAVAVVVEAKGLPGVSGSHKKRSSIRKKTRISKKFSPAKILRALGVKELPPLPAVNIVSEPVVQQKRFDILAAELLTEPAKIVVQKPEEVVVNRVTIEESVVVPVHADSKQVIPDFIKPVHDDQGSVHSRPDQSSVSGSPTAVDDAALTVDDRHVSHSNQPATMEKTSFNGTLYLAAGATLLTISGALVKRIVNLRRWAAFRSFLSTVSSTDSLTISQKKAVAQVVGAVLAGGAGLALVGIGLRGRQQSCTGE